MWNGGLVNARDEFRRGWRGGDFGPAGRVPVRGRPGVPREGQRNHLRRLPGPRIHLQCRPGRTPQDAKTAGRHRREASPHRRQPAPGGHLPVFGLRPDLRNRAGPVNRFQPSGLPGVIVGDDTDQTLLERYRSGDRNAFGELVVRYQRPLYNAAYWVLRSPEDASHITQIVFLKIAEQLDEYDPRYKFFSWIYRIAINESLNLLRRNRREEPL